MTKFSLKVTRKPLSLFISESLPLQIIFDTISGGACVWTCHFSVMQACVLEREWAGRPFSIWGGGKFGKQFYKDLKREHQTRVLAVE
jgi:hypothetical protein